jgi:hypothetical protein
MTERLAGGLLLFATVGCLREPPPQVLVDLAAAPTRLTQVPTFLEPEKPVSADSAVAGVCIYPEQGHSLTDHWTVRTPEGGEASISAHAELTDNTLATLSSSSVVGDSICYHLATNGPLVARMRRVRLVASQPIVARRIVWVSTVP